MRIQFNVRKIDLSCDYWHNMFLLLIKNYINSQRIILLSLTVKLQKKNVRVVSNVPFAFFVSENVLQVYVVFIEHFNKKKTQAICALNLNEGYLHLPISPLSCFI